jgi:hypothetical protein
LREGRYEGVKVSIVRLTLFGLGACALFGCGTGEQTPVPDLADAQPYVQIDPTVNVCPTFDASLVIPLDIPPKASAQIVVRATDPDGDSAAIIYDWTAPSGSFSNPNRSTTTYSCAALGPQALRVSALDERSCASSLVINVDCIAN